LFPIDAVVSRAVVSAVVVVLRAACVVMVGVVVAVVFAVPAVVSRCCGSSAKRSDYKLVMVKMVKW
jgi:hypothetical protein